MVRWQIYGPEQEGLSLCERHRGVRGLSDTEMIRQMVLGTAARRFRHRRERTPLLPTLQSVRHIFRKTRSRLYELSDIAGFFESFDQGPVRAARYAKEVEYLLARHAEQRRQNISRDGAERAQGMQIFERVKAHLLATGKIELAAAIQFSDFRPKTNSLYVVVPPTMAASFIGKGGRNINDLSAAVGARVSLERSAQKGMS